MKLRNKSIVLLFLLSFVGVLFFQIIPTVTPVYADHHIDEYCEARGSPADQEGCRRDNSGLTVEEACEIFTNQSSGQEFSDCVATYDHDDTTNPGDPPEDDAPVEAEQTCRSENAGLGYIICSVLEWMGDVVKSIVNFVLGKQGDEYANLRVDEVGFADSGNDDSTAYRTWTAFRLIANSFFALTFLYAIYLVAFSSGNNAFTIRSLLPRLGLAAILVQLSFFLSVYFLDFVNVLGAGVEGIFNWVFRGENFEIASVLVQSGDGARPFWEDATVGGFLVLGVPLAAGAGLFTMLASLVGVGVILMVVFFILIIRKVILIMLIVLSPLAAIAWVHRETDGLAKAWWQLFSKAALMYPIIILLLKSGEVLARTLSEVSTDDSAVSEGTFDIVVYLAYFAPYFLIPYTFRLAGGAIGQLAGVADRMRGGLTGGLKERAKASDEARKAFSNRGRLRKLANTPEGGVKNTLKRGYLRSRTNVWGATKYGRALESAKLSGAAKEGKELADQAVAEALPTVSSDLQKQVLTASTYGSTESWKQAANSRLAYASSIGDREGIKSAQGELGDIKKVQGDSQATAAIRRIASSGAFARISASEQLVSTFREIGAFEDYADHIKSAGSSAEQSDLNRMVTLNAPVLATIGPQVLKGTLASMSAIPEQLTQYKPESVRNITTKAIYQEAPNKAASGMQKMAATYVEALSNPQARSKMTIDTADAFYNQVNRYISEYYDVTTNTVNVPASISDPAQRADFEENIRETINISRDFDTYYDNLTKRYLDGTRPPPPPAGGAAPPPPPPPPAGGGPTIFTPGSPGYTPPGPGDLPPPPGSPPSSP
ncbi:MAG TPA: hypothetical protein VGA08_02530 [Candidatus Saccharimonadales bacterium]